MNYYEHHIGDYLKDTSRLSLQEHGAYLMLLSDYYANEGPLPADATELYRISRAFSRSEQAAVRTIADRYFAIQESDGLRHNKRADAEIEKAQKRIQTAKSNGAKGGRKPNPAGTQRDTQRDTRQPPHRGTRSGEALQTPHAIQQPAVGSSPQDSRTSNARNDSATVVDSQSDPLVENAMRNNPALAAVVHLRQRGGVWLRLTPTNPEIHEAIREGVPVETIEAMAEAYPDKPPLYVIRAARSDYASKPTITPTPKPENRHGPRHASSAVADTLAAIHRRREREVTSAAPALEHDAR